MKSSTKLNKKIWGAEKPSLSRRQARYGRLVRGWDWRTNPELLQQAENERIKRGISRTEFLELAILSLLGRNPTPLAPDGAYLCGKCGLMSRTTKCENCGHIYKRPAGKA